MCLFSVCLKKMCILCRHVACLLGIHLVIYNNEEEEDDDNDNKIIIIMVNSHTVLPICQCSNALPLFFQS